jgi:hypothetical protein
VALTPGQRSRRARVAAHASWANTVDRQGRTAAATASFLARFEKQVDPLGVLEPEVRAVLAQHARRAYMLQLCGAVRAGAGSSSAGRRLMPRLVDPALLVRWSARPSWWLQGRAAVGWATWRLST